MPNPRKVFSRELVDLANTAVTTLKLVEPDKPSDFFRDNQPRLLQKIKSIHYDAERSPVDSDMLFIALCLPVASGVIQVGSNAADLDAARQWVQENWGDKEKKYVPDAVSILSSLTLIHIVTVGLRQAQSSEDKEAWKKIVERVATLTEDLDAALASAEKT